MREIKAYIERGWHWYIFVLIATLAFAGSWYFFLKTVHSEVSLESRAASVLEECRNESYKPTCYEREIPKLMDEITMEDAFKVTAIVQGADPSFAYCHVLGHKLAERETAKDPSQWESVIPRCPPGICSNGCIHGAFQERFRKESLDPGEIDAFKPTFASICEAKNGWNPTGMEQATCYHALGHLLMYVTKADISQSLDLCTELAKKPDGRDFSQLCFDGAFMQIYQPLEPDDFALIAGKEVHRDEAESFCNEFNGAARGSCRSESWPLFKDDLKNPKNVGAFCDYLGIGAQRDRCVSALIYVATAQFGFNTDKASAFCGGMDGADRSICFANAASRTLENDYRGVDTAVAMCKKAEEGGVGDACYAELVRYASYNFHSDAPARAHLCSSLLGSWGERCNAESVTDVSQISHASQ